MAEIKGYTCDGGCGATTALDHAADTLANHGWFTTYTPRSLPTLYTCSFVCLMRICAYLAAERTLPQ